MTEFESVDLQDYSAPSEHELLRRNLEHKLQQQIVLTTAKDNLGQFGCYAYFDADAFCASLNKSRTRRNFVDEYSQSLFDPFLDVANLKNEKEQENNRKWLSNKSQAVRPDIFNASLSHVVLDLIEQKLNELKKDENPLEQLQYVNYTQRLNENEECIEDVENACVSSVCTKHSKSSAMWERASREQVSINTIVERDGLNLELLPR